MKRPRQPVLNLVTHVHSFAFRATRGRFGRSFRGAPILVLETRGRKSGKVRSVPLLYVEDAGDLVVMASNGGNEHHPSWYLNLEAEPRVSIVTADGRQNALAMPTDGEERERLFAALQGIYPSYQTYRERTTRELPVVRLRPQS
jgi:deazaflavin-dependent oxidoreductase (nitroreductase family)